MEKDCKKCRYLNGKKHFCKMYDVTLNIDFEKNIWQDEQCAKEYGVSWGENP